MQGKDWVLAAAASKITYFAEDSAEFCPETGEPGLRQ